MLHPLFGVWEGLADLLSNVNKFVCISIPE